MKQPRRIIQIAVTTIPEGTTPGGLDFVAYCRVYALCDDGSLWWKGSSGDDQWRRCVPIPQD